MRTRKTTVAIALASTLVGAVVIARADSETQTSNWPQWRGPNRDARIDGAAAWPKDLSGLEQVWRVELGPSYSGPIVYGRRAFVTETKDEKQEVVRALDRDTGKELWRTSWDGAMSVPFFAKANGDWIRSTPACDGTSLFVAGMRDVLVCLDVATGEIRWRVNFCERYETPVPAFGFVCSPLLDNDHVYVQAGASFVKLDKKSGSTIWRTLVDSGGMMGSAFSSPAFATIAGVRQILVQTRLELCGVDPEKGDVLWRQDVPSFRGMNILTPVAYGNGVFTSTHRNKSFFYSIRRKGGQFVVQESWTLPSQGYMSSPVVIGDNAYLHLGNGRLSCIDLQNGSEQWRSKPFGKYWSVVANSDRILALDQKGELLLIQADPEEFRLLDRREVSEDETWAHIAVSGDLVFVRALKSLTVFRW